ncbi:2Fe-2S iron-sulfur cluster binding domain-containing protein [Pseudooceanicola sp. 216_PA32_1]|uniref:2Fe-2S iron-sulfur cluster binding domain-containing protein n=1 Tax=Pseudooceanicola pacificus TaxID=2676438 RepID=A0A844WEN2_9RHOB|nr:(2Fe-2S)-binding protein [Pseudooceanicola pacificus]MWB77539.1 2Fe-2S iron-sulfur cluster binding domain-containing protein [Pseudooceanicola pacificus]
MVELNVNGIAHSVDAAPETPLLWVLRENLGKTGTKFGCGAGVCGACTVHLDGEAVRSCQVPLADAEGAEIKTIEGLSSGNGDLTKLQQSWIDLQVPQCGYCQSGMIMAAAALLKATPKPTDDDIDAAMTNICRCGTYSRVRAAIHRAAGTE